MEFLSRIDPKDLEAQLHLLRHFEVIDDSYRAQLIGRTYDREDWSDEEKKLIPAEVTGELTDDLLAERGSKFTSAIANPKELIEFAKERALTQAMDNELIFVQGPFGARALLEVEMAQVIGRDAVVPLSALSEDEKSQLELRPRGKVNGDELLVNITTSHPGIESNRIAVVIGESDGGVYVFTAHPGRLTPDLPRDYQTVDERRYNTEWWKAHAFLG